MKWLMSSLVGLSFFGIVFSIMAGVALFVMSGFVVLSVLTLLYRWLNELFYTALWARRLGWTRKEFNFNLRGVKKNGSH